MGWGQHEVFPSWVGCRAKLGGHWGLPQSGASSEKVEGAFLGWFGGFLGMLNPLILPSRAGAGKG